MRGDIPVGWKATVLGEHLRLQSGFAFPSSAFGKGSVPAIRMSDLADGVLELSSSARVSERYLQIQREVVLRVKDLLVGMSGSLTNYAVVQADDLPALLNQRVGRFLLESAEFHYPLLRYIVTGPAYERQLRIEAVGAAQLNISPSQVGALKLNLPPLPEQRRIAEILDTLDEAIRKTEQIIKKLQQVKQGLLHDLLTRGINEHGQLRDPQRHPEQFKDSPLGRIPKEWEVRTLSTLADVSSGSTPSRGVSGFWTNGTVPWVKTGEVAFMEIRSTEEHVTSAGVAAARLCLYPPGTVLVAMYGQGATRGRVALLSVSATTNQACAALCPLEGRCKSRFLFHYLSAQYERMRSLGHGSNQTNLSGSLLGAMDVIHPPLEEQVRIVDVLDRHTQQADGEGRTLSKLRTLKQGLMDDLLTGRVRVNVGDVPA